MTGENVSPFRRVKARSLFASARASSSWFIKYLIAWGMVTAFWARMMHLLLLVVAYNPTCSISNVGFLSTNTLYNVEQ